MNESRNIAKLSTGELIRRLRPAQLWAAGAALVVLVTGAFTVGHSLGQYRTKAMEERTKKMEERLQRVESKQGFFVRYLRYLIAKEELEKSRSAASEQAFKLQMDMFVRLIETWWRQQESFDGKLILDRKISREGDDPTHSRVIFANGMDWLIPSEIKMEVLKRVE